MEANAIDRYFVAECVKQEVDEVYKKTRIEADEELAKLRDEHGSLSATSRFFGPEAGEFKYSQTKKKEVVEYALEDMGEFDAWCDSNHEALRLYAASNAVDFAKWWTETTGEPVGGISVEKRTIPAGLGKAKIYRLDPDAVKGKLDAGLMEGAAELLLGGGQDG